jgi:hypothetical protein
VIGSPYYWAFVGAITLAFAVIDLNALSRRTMTRAHGAAVAVYVTTFVIVGGLSLPVAPLGSLWWVFPAAVRIAVFATIVGGQLLAGAVLAEQAIVHPQRRPPAVPQGRLTEAELRDAEAYDSQWQIEDRQRNRERELDERELHERRRRDAHSRPSGADG